MNSVEKYNYDIVHVHAVLHAPVGYGSRLRVALPILLLLSFLAVVDDHQWYQK